MSIFERIKNGWNAFMGREPPIIDRGYSSTRRPDSKTLSRGVDRTIVTAIYNRIAMDVAAVDIKHVIVDQNENYKEPYLESYLSNALTLSANIDQTGRELIQDTVLSMFDDGHVALVPTDAWGNPRYGPYDPITLRTGQIIEWYPRDVKVRVYNDRTGQREEITLPKKAVAIIKNPLYEVMNQPNSTLQRLIKKLTLLDVIDEETSVGKLDMIIQLPYVIKTEERRAQAEKRRKDIETQLADSKYGIAYTDGTEHIMQLNRSLENNLLGQIEFLTSMLYSQLGISKEVFDGTADERVMLNYNNRTVTPILMAITEEMTRKFLTKTAYTRKQRIKFLQEPFRLVSTSQIAEIADKFIRSQILSPNELRGIAGFKPVDDPKADELRNTNLNEAADGPPPASTNPDINRENAEQELKTGSNSEAVKQKLLALINKDEGGNA